MATRDKRVKPPLQKGGRVLATGFPRRKELKALRSRWKRHSRTALVNHGPREGAVWQAIQDVVPPQGQCPVSRNNSPAEVYFCEEGGRHKIGVGFSAMARMHSLTDDSGFRPKLYATIACSTRDLAEAIEKYLHWLLRQYRWEGEWFAFPAELVVSLKASYLGPGKLAVAAFRVFDEDTIGSLRTLVKYDTEPAEPVGEHD